ncbi:hypothetical protein [Lactobacillus sp. ESL0681]|uniref:hypothetical protein n=1 Tax=Lactobacillus sp. ESL0681 TaxID=2983211 RepID=UPI0023F87A6A|nr:hypothetical protein [Lactobacillus sp. ESL0681]WEV40351.1 hypothetical protein OZX59_00085 [Lactobacillus sp. ESL0681]
MNPRKMSIQEIDQHFYGRNVEFTLNNGKKKTIFVQDILNEEDDEPELTFIGDSIENEIGISDIVSAEAV